MCSICSFHKRTSEIKLSLLERVEIGQGITDEVGREPHLERRLLYLGREICDGLGCESLRQANWVVWREEIAWFGRLRRGRVVGWCDFLAVLMLLVRFFLTSCDLMRHLPWYFAGC